MDRRLFVRNGIAGFAALTVPGWLAACRRGGGAESSAAQDVRDAAPSLASNTPSATALLAAADGLDVVVLRADDGDARAQDLGHVVGVLLQTGEAAQLAVFAQLDVACATTREWTAIAPELASDPEVRAVLVRADRPPRACAVGTPPALPEARASSSAWEQAPSARNAWFADQLLAAVEDDEPWLARRAAEERAARPGWDDQREPSFANARRWPRNSRLAARTDLARAAEWDAASSEVAGMRWRRNPPTGSAWASSTGCGTRWDPPPGREVAERARVACGMARTPATSRRFLHFYTREELGT